MSKVAVITGGAQGIGKAIAAHFLKQGLAVVIADIDAEAGSETVATLCQHGPIHFVETDVACEESVVRLMSETVRLLGGIDILVNNSAIMRTVPITDLSLSDWNRVLGVNLTGVFLCAKHAAPHLKQRQGAIVNIASTRAFMSEPNTEAYSASKGGVVAVTHALAISLGPDIRVNCVSPGWIEVSDWKKASVCKTPVHSDADRLQHPVGRVGHPDDIARLVLYLASDGAGFITGANFTVDGGMTHKMIYV